jgi:hypothetical protein
LEVVNPNFVVVRFHEQQNPNTIAEDQSAYEVKSFQANWYLGKQVYNILLDVYALKLMIFALQM